MSNANRRKFIGTAAALAVGAVAASAKPFATSKSLQPLIHHVFFWLKNPHSAEDRKKQIEGIQSLAKIESIRTFHVGVVADTEKREVVDASWDVSLLIFFDDVSGQESYQTHSVHLEFVKNYSHLWERVVVYDAMTI